MELNKENFVKLLHERFEGNYTRMAKAINVSPAQLYRIVNGNSKAGAKFLGKLIAYCKANDIDYEKFIFLPKLLIQCNSKNEKTKVQQTA